MCGVTMLNPVCAELTKYNNDFVTKCTKINKSDSV